MRLVCSHNTNPTTDPTRGAVQTFWRWSDEQFDRLCALTRDVDCVELKLTVPEPAHAATCTALGAAFTNARASRYARPRGVASGAKPVPHAGFGEEVLGAGRVVFEFAAQLGHVLA